MTDTPFTLAAGDSADPLLLCLHGIGSCADAFIAQFPLAQRCRRQVVAWDAPGYRRSADIAGSFTLDDWADAAAALIEQHDGTADVLGVSWGGVTATRLALRRPDLVRSLILADSSVGSGTNPGQADAMRDRARDYASLGADEFCRSRAPRLVAPDAPPELIASIAMTMLDSVRYDSYDLACRSMADTDHTHQLGMVRARTLVIVGDQDIITPRERADALAAGIPGAELATIAGAGHLANQERPDDFNNVVAEFLDRVSGATAGS